jgi:hypothetical protein
MRGESEPTAGPITYLDHSGKLERARVRVAEEGRKKAAKRRKKTSVKRDG